MNDGEVKKVLSFTIKFTITAGLLFWCYHSGKLDTQSALSLLSHPNSLAAASVFVFIQILLTSFRWNILLKIKLKKPISFLSILGIQWIGKFLASVLPGGVANDLIKIKYVKNLEKLETQMPLLITFNLLFFLLALIIYSFFFIKEESLAKLFGGIPYTKKFIQAAAVIGNNKSVLVKTIFVGLLSHLVNISTFHLINFGFYQTEVKFSHLLMILPLGQLSTALPISISGLGVGHVVYEKIFLTIQQTNGAILFNNYWLLNFLVNLLGFIPFLWIKIRQEGVDEGVDEGANDGSL